jgi:hypothetical protein
LSEIKKKHNIDSIFIISAASGKNILTIRAPYPGTSQSPIISTLKSRNTLRSRNEADKSFRGIPEEISEKAARNEINYIFLQGLPQLFNTSGKTVSPTNTVPHGGMLQFQTGIIPAGTYTLELISRNGIRIS